MIKHTFTRTDLFYAQYYRYRSLLAVLIVGFGLFAIGTMVVSGAPFLIGLLLFFAYVVMSFMLMFLLLWALALIYYHVGYKGVVYSYQVTEELLCIRIDDKEVIQTEYDTLETKVYKRMTYIYDQDHVLAFFPEEVRRQLLT